MVIGFEREPPWLDSIQPYLPLPPLPPSLWIAGFILYYHVSPRSQLFAAPVSLYYPQGALQNAGKLLRANHRRRWSRKQENFIGLSRFSSNENSSKVFLFIYFFREYMNYWLIKNFLNMKYEIIIHSTFSIFFFLSVGIIINRSDLKSRQLYFKLCEEQRNSWIIIESAFLLRDCRLSNRINEKEATKEKKKRKN